MELDWKELIFFSIFISVIKLKGEVMLRQSWENWNQSQLSRGGGGAVISWLWGQIERQATDHAHSLAPTARFKFPIHHLFFDCGRRWRNPERSPQREQADSTLKGHWPGDWTRNLINQSKGQITPKGISEHFTQSKREGASPGEQHEATVSRKVPGGKKPWADQDSGEQPEHRSVGAKRKYKIRIDPNKKSMESEWQAGWSSQPMSKHGIHTREHNLDGT